MGMRGVVVTAAAPQHKKEDPVKRCSECPRLVEYEYSDYCQQCCEHEFDPNEGWHCLECGKDGSEEMMAAAYDRAKDLRKYGE